MSMHGSAMTYVTAAYSTDAIRPSISSLVRSKSADFATTRSKPAACAPRSPAVSVWLEKPTIGMSGHASATSSGSIREMSASTSSGSAIVSVVTR